MLSRSKQQQLYSSTDEAMPRINDTTTMAIRADETTIAESFHTETWLRVEVSGKSHPVLDGWMDGHMLVSTGMAIGIDSSLIRRSRTQGRTLGQRRAER